MPKRLQSAITRHKRIEESMRTVLDSVFACQREVAAALRKAKGDDVRILTTAQGHLDAVYAAAQAAHRQLWIGIEGNERVTLAPANQRAIGNANRRGETSSE